MSLYECLVIYFALGLGMYLCDEFDDETDTPEFNFRDVIAFTILGAAIKAKNILVQIKSAIAGQSGKVGIVTYIKTIFARHFKTAPKKAPLDLNKKRDE